jgi:hypothetical protein
LRRARTALFTFAASAALHAVVLALLLTRESAPRPPAPEQAIEIQLVETPVSPSPLEGPPPSSKRPGSPNRSPTPGLRLRPSGSAQADRGGDGVAIEPLVTDVPFAEAKVATARPDDVSLLKQLPRPALVIGPRSGLRAPERPRDAQELVAGTATAAVNARRIESGNIPTYFTELKSMLVVAWDIDSVVNRHPAMGQTGATLKVVQDRSGLLVEVHLLAPSGDRDFDKSLITDLQRASASFPKPPPDAIGEREQLASVWAFVYRPLALDPPSFDIVNLIDPRAIPRPSPKKLSLLYFE